MTNCSDALKKLSAVFLISCIVFGVNGCTGKTEGTGPDDPGSVPSVETAAETAVTAAEDSRLIFGGECRYRVVRADKASEKTIALAVSVRDSLQKYCSNTIEIATDFIKSGVNYPDETYEILVGDCDYSQYSSVAEGLGYLDYRIKACGNKFVIAAESDKSLEKAVEEFCRLIRKNIDNYADGGTALVFNSAFCLEGNCGGDETFSSLPFEDWMKKAELYENCDGGYMIINKNADSAYFDKYGGLLTEAGFSIAASHEAAGNLYRTYTGHGGIVNIMYVPSYKYFYVISESDGVSALPPSDKNAEYEKLCDRLFIQVGLEDGGLQNGMCYIMRLYDGSFIIVDGGLNNVNMKKISAVLKKYAPDPAKITVSAWFLTHSHNDHWGALKAYITNSASYSYIHVERVIYNNGDGIFADIDLISGGDYDGVYVRANEKLFGEIIIAHPGQMYYFPGAVIEMMYSADIHSYITNCSVNDTSLVFRFDFGGQTALITGDAGWTGADSVAKMYLSYLKSDMLQVIHHGYAGGTVQIYKYIDPEILLWPLGDADYAYRPSENSANIWLFGDKNIKEILQAGARIYVMDVPYTAGTSESISVN